MATSGEQKNQYATINFYNVEPALQSLVFPGAEIYMGITIHNYTNITGRSIALYITPKNDEFFPIEIGYTDVNFPNEDVAGTTYTSIKCKIPTGLDYFFKDRYAIEMNFYFAIYDAKGGENGNYNSTSNTYNNIGSNHYFVMKRYALLPEIKSLSFERANKHEIIIDDTYDHDEYTFDNEGLYALCTDFKISINSVANIDDIKIKTIEIKNIGSVETYNIDKIPDEILELALTDDGYVEVKPELLDFYQFLTLGAYDITINIGDSVELATFTYRLERAFANMHLSGAENGGVAFGGFSNSTDDNPMHEVFYPSYFYGGIKYIDSESIKVIGNIVWPIGSRITMATGTISDSNGNSLDYEKDPNNIFGGYWKNYTTGVWTRVELYDPENDI